MQIYSILGTPNLSFIDEHFLFKVLHDIKQSFNINKLLLVKIIFSSFSYCINTMDNMVAMFLDPVKIMAIIQVLMASS